MSNVLTNASIRRTYCHNSVSYTHLRIISQLKKLGSSCDWDRERFTMDEGCNKAVTEVFVKMHEKGYIYKGARIVNWCPVCNTSISDAEVEYQEQAGHFWHIKYPLMNEDGTPSTTEFLTFATTRPETMFCLLYTSRTSFSLFNGI